MTEIFLSIENGPDKLAELVRILMAVSENTRVQFPSSPSPSQDHPKTHLRRHRRIVPGRIDKR